MARQELLRMENISKDYYGNQVLSDVTLRVDKGEIVGLVGENGAGKSTLMNILFGMTIIAKTGGYRGTITLDGNPVSFTDPIHALKAGIGMVHQEFCLIPGFTAMENIVLNKEPTRANVASRLFGPKLATIDTNEMERRSRNAIDHLKIDLDPHMVVSEMPVGYKQFTEIAREIDRLNTKLIVLDEPTAVLTESEASALLTTMKRLAANGIALIFITHRLQEVLDCTDKIVILRDGRLIRETAPGKTSIREIAEAMVGRSMGEASQKPKKASPAASGPAALEVASLWVDMPGEFARDVSFSVYKGEFFGIGGLAGQGKLAIPNGLMGLYPCGGTVRLSGQTLQLNQTRLSCAAGMAFVSEDRRGVGLLLNDSIESNIAFTAIQIHDMYLKRLFGGFIRWRDDQAIRKLSQEYMAMLDIKCTSSQQAARELSGGNQQKVCLARAFALKPQILFVSEPTRGIDIGAKKLVLDVLQRYNREYGTTIIMISSELEELRSQCDRIAIINEGRVAGILPANAEVSQFGLLMIGKGTIAVQEQVSA
ncbi:MAG: sugar ABC transporter ATP-binding protein [Chitinivibrionales bacterium]|nr:sugar ABC transporter ATP-binding protein [Chitinivibrionales bacterium]